MAVVLLCLLLTGCALRRRVEAWPGHDQMSDWRLRWQNDDRGGCEYFDWYKRQACNLRHGEKL